MMDKQPIQREREFKFSDDDFKTIVNLVKDTAGIQLGDHKRDMVYGRLVRRLRELKYQSFSQYLDFLHGDSGEDELIHFVNAITTNLTKFFREEHHFEHLKNYIQSLIQAKHKRIRIWSAGCSSGAEPYSIAMTILEALGGDASQVDIKVLATDIDTNMLATASNGVYPASMLEQIPEALQKKYTLRTSEGGIEQFTMVDKAKELIRFNQLNLLKEWPMKGPFDVIFCRNVVIYFSKDTQRQLFERYANLLASHGILYIGHSESLFGVSDRFELQGRTIYRKVR